MKMNYLDTVAFSNFYMWDVKRFSKSSLLYSVPTIILSKILSKPDIEWIDIEDDKDYPILGVKSQGQGVYINRVSEGSELTMKRYQKSIPNHLFFCKVRTVKGQWGIVYNEFGDSYGSSNMTYLKIDEEIVNLHYFELILKIKKITDEWDLNAVGADGRHFPLKTLLGLKIPLPTLKEQNRIVENYNTKITLADKQEKEAKQLEKGIEEYLFDELGIKIYRKQKETGMQLTHFYDMKRWDVLYLQDKIPSMQSNFTLCSFKSAIKYFNKEESSKSIRVNSTEYPEDDFRYIGMEHIQKQTGTLLKFNNVKGDEIKSQTLKVPKGYFLFGKLRPYLNKYWINDTNHNDIICSSEFFVFKINDTINPYFFKSCLSSKFIQTQISDKTSGARMPRINEEIFMNLLFPLPQIETQNKIADKITKSKITIEHLNQQAQQNRVSALEEFEKEIFAV